MLIPPPVAVTVRVVAAIGAVAQALRFTLLLPLPGAAILAGTKIAVTPEGSPLTDMATEELNPFPPTLVKVTFTDPLRAKLTLVELAVSVKVPVTVRLKFSSMVAPPPTAPSVRVEVPGVAVEATARVNVLLPLPGAAMLGWVKVAVTPLWSPLTDK